MYSQAIEYAKNLLNELKKNEPKLFEELCGCKTEQKTENNEITINTNNADLIYISNWKKDVSFNYVAEQYANVLMNMGLRVAKIDISDAKVKYNKPVLIHPINSFMTDRHYLPNASKLFGIEPIESDEISDLFLSNYSKFNTVFTHSQFGVNVFNKYNIDAVFLPHTYHPLFLRSPRMPKHQFLRTILDEKVDNGYIYILYFLWHSGSRKGADITSRIISRLSNTHSNIKLMLKRKNVLDYYLDVIRILTSHVEIAEDLTINDLIDLYDISDIVLLTSRSEGFGLNGLEGLLRGKIVVVPDTDMIPYRNYCVTYNVSSSAYSYDRYNYFHIGKGIQPDESDLYEKLSNVVENLDTYKLRFKNNVSNVLKEYSYYTISKIFDKYLVSEL
jgi:hypothetical protein